MDKFQVLLKDKIMNQLELLKDKATDCTQFLGTTHYLGTAPSF